MVEDGASPPALGPKKRKPPTRRRTRRGVGMARRRWIGPTDDELAALDELGKDGTWSVDGVEVKLTNLDKVLFPARDGEDPVTKREPDRLPRPHRPARPPLPGRPTGEPAAVPRRRRRQGLLEQGGARPRRPDWLTQWHYDAAPKDETQWYMVLDRPASLVYAAQLAGFEMHPWTSLGDEPQRPTWALHRHRPWPAVLVRRRRLPGHAPPHGTRPPRRGRAARRSRGSTASRSGSR